ncbi:MAG: ThuA domain-containing protein [Marinoscillum sp.]
MIKSNRRSFLSKAATLSLASTIPFNLKATPMMKKLPSLQGKKVLFVYGGWDGHEPLKYRDYLGEWLRDEGAEVTLSDSLEVYTDEALMNNTDLVIQIYTMSQISKEQEAGLLKAVQAGMGIAGWHGGLCDAFRSNVAYQFMTGGQWVAHPGGVIDYSVQIRDQTDEVTSGLKDFPMTSEQYYMHVDPNVKVLATTRFNGEVNSWIDGCVIPVTWKKMFGKGRVFYTSVGHNLEHITSVPDAIEMLKRGIKWASASKYEPAEDWLNPVYK